MTAQINGGLGGKGKGLSQENAEVNMEVKISSFRFLSLHIHFLRFSILCILSFGHFFFSETLIVFSGSLELMRQMSSIKKQFKNMLLISMSSVNELI